MTAYSLKMGSPSPKRYFQTVSSLDFRKKIEKVYTQFLTENSVFSRINTVLGYKKE